MDPLIFLETLGNAFARVPWARLFGSLHRVFLLADALLAAGFIALFARAVAAREKIDTRAVPPSIAQILSKPGFQAAYAERWRSVQAGISANPPESFRAAIVAADALIDEMLTEAGFEGSGMAERLGRLNGLGIRSLDGVFRAHRIRNDLAHASSVSLTERDASRVMGLYARFLKEVKVL